MSIEAALAENTASNLALAVAIAANTTILEKLEAGREAAVTALENKTDKPSRTTRKKAEEPAAGNGDNAGTGSQAAGATAVAEPTGPSDDDLRNAATGYIQGAGEDKAKRGERGANIKSITDHFGTKTLVGETGITGVDERTKALFFLNRFAAGQTVDFSVDYDFAGDPAQGAEAEDFDAIG